MNKAVLNKLLSEFKGGMKEELVNEVMHEVGQQLLEEGRKQQEQLQTLFLSKIEESKQQIIEQILRELDKKVSFTLRNLKEEIIKELKK